MRSRIGRLFGVSGGLVGCASLSLFSAIACNTQVGIGTGDGAGGSAGSVASAGGSAGSATAGAPTAGGSQGGAGFGGSVASGGQPSGGESSGPRIESSNKLDVLFVIDNSGGMEQKLPRFRQAALAFLQHLIAPRCVSPAASLEVPPDMPCPSGTQRERTPVKDIHAGVITTSLGAHGGDVCTNSADDDHAHLIATMRDGIPSYAGLGFAKWDADQTAEPAGSSTSSEFLGQVSSMLDSVGVGCGYEAQLESWYRFLVDPKPPLLVLPQGEAEGIDDTVLEQRAAFLRPDSAVSIVLVSDENDCSIRDEKQGWLVSTGSLGGGSFTMPRATSACAEDPNSPCCMSCLATDVASGCTPPGADPACATDNLLKPIEDSMNLRCWDQKRRFGVDFLYPTSKYVEALTSSTVVDRTGAVAPNPLFASTPAGPRSPRLVTFTTLVGVPWQDIADESSAELKLQNAEQLAQNGRWNVLIGANGLPDDPFMRESTYERSGVNPITQDPILPSTLTNPVANAINGHELNYPQRDDLQPACTFALQTPLACDDDPTCACAEGSRLTYSSLCQASADEAPGGTQYRTAARPGLRQLAVQSQIGTSAVVGTICVDDAATSSNESGYTPSFDALSRRLGQVLP